MAGALRENTEILQTAQVRDTKDARPDEVPPDLGKSRRGRPAGKVPFGAFSSAGPTCNRPRNLTFEAL